MQHSTDQQPNLGSWTDEYRRAQGALYRATAHLAHLMTSRRDVSGGTLRLQAIVSPESLQSWTDSLRALQEAANGTRELATRYTVAYDLREPLLHWHDMIRAAADVTDDLAQQASERPLLYPTQGGDTPMKDTTTATTALTGPEPKPDPATCPKCGQYQEAEVSNCPNCGAPM